MELFNNYWVSLLILGVCAFFQNMAFTAVSRSRNSGDPSYHRYCAWASNGVWFVTHFMILRQVWEVLETGDWLKLIPVMIVYVFATAEGSVLMMKILLKKEKGNRRVGSNANKG